MSRWSRLHVLAAAMVFVMAVDPGRVGYVSSGPTDYQGWSVLVIMSIPGGLALLLSARTRAART